jgi:hypothetical protein
MFAKKKSPGFDGLPIEFYLHFEDQLVPTLKRLYTVIFEKSELSKSMYTGVISQLYKGSSEKTSMSNWRPLTMLNVDYKILAKILVNRLKVVMPHIVHKSQTCAVPGRDIRDGVSLLYNVIHYVNQHKLDGILLSVDHMRAFDIIEWNYVLKVLEYFKLGETLIKWVSLIYKFGRVQSTVQVNGFLSEPFKVTRGIRQGCPLSALLYVLVSEVVTNYIRNLESVKGINILNLEYKISNYADDTNFIVSDFNSVRNIFEVYDIFKLASGATLKTEKTKILLFGSSRAETIPTNYAKYVVQKLKIYGIIFDRFGTDQEENIKGLLESFDVLKTRHVHHEVSYIARMRIIETYYLSKLWFVCLFIELSAEVIKKIEDSSCKFVWYPKTGSRNPVKLQTLKLDIDKGGIHFIDILKKQTSFLVMHLIKTKKTKPGGNEIFWHFYEQAKTALSRNRLFEMHIPYMYKLLRYAELRNRMLFTDTGVLLRNELFCYDNVSNKLLYSKLTDRQTPCDMKYWTENLDKPANTLVKLHALSNSKYIPGSVKNTHYSIVHKFIHTRSKQAHISAQVDPFCKHCSANNAQHRETIMHCIVDCPRLFLFWNRFKNIVNRVDISVTIGKVEQIFGIAHESKEIEVLLNLLLQIGQKSIWQTRWKLESKNKQVEVWAHFKKQLLFQMLNLFKMINRDTFNRHFITHRIVKMSRYKIILDFE